MKPHAVLAALAGLAICLPSVFAGTGGRIVEIEGDVTFADGRAAAAGLDIQDGATLAARPGARARVSIPGVGVIRLVGPAAVRVDHADGIPVVTVLRGTVSFGYERATVRLVVEGGRLELSGVNGRTATLAPGSDVLIQGDGDFPRVVVRAGTALFSGGLEHDLVRAGESRSFRAPQDSSGSLLLSGQDLQLQLPSEVLLEERREPSSALDELEAAWDRNRESPRIP